MKKLTLFLFSILTLFFIAPSYSEEKFISDFAEEVKLLMEIQLNWVKKK